MMRSPQALPIKTLSVLLALLMLCTATTFVSTQVGDRQFKLIVGSVALPVALGHGVAGVVRPMSTNTVARPHLDPHRRLPAADRSGASVRGSLDRLSRNIRASRLDVARSMPSRTQDGQKGRRGAQVTPIVTIAR